MMKKIFLTVTLAALNYVVLAQATLEIILVDHSNNPVPSQYVLVKNNQIGYKKEAFTSTKGKLQLGGLSTSGWYSVKVQEGSFYRGKEIKNISLISDKTTSVTLILEEKSVELDALTITSEKYLSINSVDAEVASELSAQEIREIPVEGRDITRTLYRLPNISQATGFFPEAPNVAINGANPLYTNYQIDGLDNNENFLGGQRFSMPVGFTKNITALTNNFSAEHGLTSNGIINITSKSGTNNVSGEVFYVTRPGPVIDAPSPYAQRDLSGNQVKDGFQRHQGGFAVGGPLVKDQTFYFLNVEHTTDIKDNLLNVPELGVNETIRGTNHFTYISGKIDHNWTDGFWSSLRVNTGLTSIERQGGGLDGGVTFGSAGNSQNRNSLNIALKNTYVGNRFTYEGNYLYGRFRWNYANPENPDSPNVIAEGPSGLPVAVLGHPGFVFDDTENTHVLQQKLTFNRKGHRFKTGLQIKSSGFELFGGGNPNGSYTVLLDSGQLAQLRSTNPDANLSVEDLPANAQVLNYGIELRPSAFEKRQNIFSFYFEDQWTLSSRLNVNLGIRYDYDNLSAGGGDEGDYNNIAPRISANYKLSGNSSLRAGYGMYYDKILYAVYSDARQFNSSSGDYQRQVSQLVEMGILPSDTDIDEVTNEGNLNASVSAVEYLQGPSADELQSERENIFQNELRILNPSGYDNPYSHQFMLGFQKKVRQNFLFYLDLMHNRSYDLFRLRNLNAPEPYEVNSTDTEPRSPADADLTRPIPIYNNDGSYALINGDTLRGIARNIVMTETEGRSNYYAMNITLQKDKGSDPYSFRLMYTLSYLENNTEDINFRAMDGNDFEAEWGPSINDRRHLINAIATYYPIDNLSVTVAALIQSGQPINRIPDREDFGGTTDLNGDGRSFSAAYVGNNDRYPGESRNSDRLPWSETFDLSIYYTLPLIFNNDRVEFGTQIFNIFNAENLSGYANNATQSNQIQVGPSGSSIVTKNAAPPRQFQFSLRYLF